MPEQAQVLTPGEDVFTLRDLLMRAATFQSVTLGEDASKAVSEPFAIFDLDDDILSHLSERGIGKQARPDRDKLLTLVDTNPQEPAPGFAASNYWNFRTGGDKTDELQIKLHVGLVDSERERGIVFTPRACGSFVSPSDHLPNMRMFKALVDSGECSVPGIAHLIADSDDGMVVISWTILGLGGIRTMSALFRECFVGKAEIERLVHHADVFSPNPYPRQEPGDKQFVTEPAQPRLFKTWTKQLKEYRARLVV